MATDNRFVSRALKQDERLATAGVARRRWSQRPQIREKEGSSVGVRDACGIADAGVCGHLVRGSAAVAGGVKSDVIHHSTSCC
jgi:hypothetical protein